MGDFGWPPGRRRYYEAPILDEAGVVKLLEAAVESRLYVPICLAATTGMRRGEILGLRWADVNLEARTITVRTAVEVTKSGNRLKQPKSRSGRRTITLPDLAVEALRQQWRTVAREKIQLGPAYQDNDLVCPWRDGTIWKPNSFSSLFREFYLRTGLPRTTFHGLRHGHVSLLMGLGISPKLIAERAGHSSPAFTLSVYGHTLPNGQEQASRAVDEALGAARESAKHA